MREIRSYYYTDGSAALSPEIEQLPDREQREREIREEEKRRRKKQTRKNVRALRSGRLTAVYVSTFVLLFAGFFGGYVHYETSISSRMKSISALEKEIADMKAYNAAAQSRIDTNTDINRIKKIALKDYDMVYANSGQIVYYDIAPEDYMSQIQ
ncbi:MAG: hypothetical protein K6B14_01080 [Lachnospiraceae bacterium]|nr:hypothetical protein [Lachnospiraceae bacterium]